MHTQAPLYVEGGRGSKNGFFSGDKKPFYRFPYFSRCGEGISKPTISFVLFILKLLNYCLSRCSYQKLGLEEGEKMEKGLFTWKDSLSGRKINQQDAEDKAVTVARWSV